MKRRTIITSILVIVLCLGLISGSTFALFTSESSVNIAVTSGKVNVVATLKELVLYSATADTTGLTDAEKADVAGTILPEDAQGAFAGTYYYDELTGTTFTNGGTATLGGTPDVNVLTIDKITPGDKVKVNVDVKNNSNVAIQYRVRVNVLEGDDAAGSYKLFNGLKVKIGANAADELNSTIRVSAWTPLPAETAIDDIPVEIYLPLEAGNEYQGLTTKLLLTVEAVQGNANTSTLAGINAVLKASSQKNATMYDAIKELAAGYTYEQLKGYVWSVDNDLFYAESDVESSFEYRFFKVYTEMPATQTFSIYADPSWDTAEVNNLTVGFDAGEATGITTVTYDRSTATTEQDVVIRTNSGTTTVTINAPKDVVKHYGTAGVLSIVAVAGSSYHEYGVVGFLDISTGHIALEKTSEVSKLHFNATQETSDKVFKEIVVSYDKSLSDKLPEFSRDDVEIPEGGKLVVELQKVDNTQEETKTTSDFIWLTKQGIFEQIKVSDNNESLEDAKWADDDDNVDDDTQLAAQQIANNIGRGTNGEVSTNVTVNNVVYTVTLNEARELVVKDDDNKVVEETTTIEAVVSEAVLESGLTETQKEDVQFVATLFEGGKGTSTDPYLISTFNALLNVDAVSTGSETLYYRVVENLVADDATTSWANGFLYKDPATYVIDLNKNTLTVKEKPIFGYAVNLEIYNGTINYTGGAAFVDAACEQNMDSYNMYFHDLVLTGEIENSEAHYGPLVSYAYLINSGKASFNASNIVNNLTINNKNSDGYTGGLFGYIQGSAVSCSVTNCTFNGTIVSPHAAPFVNTCSAPKAGVTSENNTFNGRLLATKDVHLFGCNGNVTGGSATLAALASSVTEGDNAVKTVLPASTDLISLSEINEVVLNRVEGASTYRVAVLFMVNYLENGTGGYPRYITVDKAQFGAESVNTGIYRYAIHQVAEDLSEGKTVVTNQSGTLIWIESNGYHVYQPSYELSNSKATINAYAYDANGDIIAYQTIPYSYE